MAALAHIRHGNRFQPIARAVVDNGAVRYAWIESLEMLYFGRLPDGRPVLYPEVEPLLRRAGAMTTFESAQIPVAAKKAEALRQRGLPLAVHVNVTPPHLEEGHTLRAVTEALAEHPALPPSRLVVEVTEAANWRDLGAARDQLAALKQTGVRLALDDLGAGHSLSLAMAGGYDLIKIDLALTRAAARFDSAKQVAGRLMDLARDQGAEVIVEGVAIEDIGWWIERGGVRLLQSYAFAKPFEDDETLDNLLSLAPSLPLLAVG